MQSYSHTSLPAPLTPLVGRDAEVAALLIQLQHVESRLLTLTGPPGVGKTRLALEAALQARDRFGDGAVFISLASIGEPDLIAATIAQALEVHEDPGQSLRDSLTTFLRNRHLLIVLDNFEQVVAAAAFVAVLLAAAPHLQVLITSRTALRIYGEHEFPVPPLGLPDPKVISLREMEGVSALLDYAAVRLFVQRARAVRPDFQLTNDNAHAVVEICRRLDGLPLAIELAAARIKVLAPQMLLARLESRLKLLTGGAQTLPIRQQTLRNTIDWSYTLLEAPQQSLFRWLGVFVGGCTLEAAEALAGAEGSGIRDQGSDELLPAPDPQPLVPILEGLAALVDQSLVRQEEGPDGEPRFTMLETIREYALDQLAASGEEPALRQRHAIFFLRLAEQARPELTGPQQAEWLARLEAEHDNLRAALSWSLQKEEGGRRKDEGEHSNATAPLHPSSFILHPSEVGLRLAGALWRFWYTHGYLSEGRRWLESALALAPMHLAHAGATLNIASRSLIEARALALRGLGGLIWTQGDYTQAQSYFEQSITLYRQLRDEQGIASALNTLGTVAIDQGDYARAHALLGESLALFQKLEDVLGIARASGNLGMVALYCGDYQQAQQFLTEALGLYRQAGEQRSFALALGNLGEIALRQSDSVQAQTLYTESLALRRELGDKEGIAYCLEGLAGVAAARGQWERATGLWGAAEALREEIGAPLPPADRAIYEPMVEEARARLGATAWDSAWAMGQAMALEQAIAEALDHHDRAG